MMCIRATGCWQVFLRLSKDLGFADGLVDKENPVEHHGHGDHEDSLQSRQTTARGGCGEAWQDEADDGHWQQHHKVGISTREVEHLQPVPQPPNQQAETNPFMTIINTENIVPRASVGLLSPVSITAVIRATSMPITDNVRINVP